MLPPGFARAASDALSSTAAHDSALSIVPIDRPPNPGRHDRVTDPSKEARWQIAIADRWLAAGNRPDVVARPCEPVPFGDDDPRPIARKAEVAPDGVRHFDRQLIAGRGLGGHRHDMDLIDSVLGLDDQDDRNRPVLYTFIATFNVLVFPQVAVVQNLAWLRKG